MQDRAAEDGRDPVGAELERGDDTEVAAATPDCPEQVTVCVVARGRYVSGREHDLGGEEVVDRHPVAAHQPGQAAAEREPCDAGARDHAAGRGEAKNTGCAVELAHGDAGLSAHRSPCGVHMDALHRREVDHQPAFGHGLAGDVVPAAAHGDLEVSLPSGVHCVDDVGGIAATRDQRWALVDESVVDLAEAVEVVVAGGSVVSPGCRMVQFAVLGGPMARGHAAFPVPDLDQIPQRGRGTEHQLLAR